MAATQTFYLNAPTLSDATAVFIDAATLILAPDGYYSDGAIVRQQISGILGVASTYICEQDCGVALVGSDSIGVYDIVMDLDPAASTGAIIVRFDPNSTPKGIQATYDSVIYNELSSESYGYIAGTVDLPTYIGATSLDCGLSGSTLTLTKYKYIGGSPVIAGGSEYVSIATGQVQLKAASPNKCVMVVPKPLLSSELLYLKVIVPCSGGDSFDISVECPTSLPSIQASAAPEPPDGPDPDGKACTNPKTQVYHYASVTLLSAGDLALYDVVFEDAYGSERLADTRGEGYYSFVNSDTLSAWFRINEHSIVIDMGLC